MPPKLAPGYADSFPFARFNCVDLNDEFCLSHAGVRKLLSLVCVCIVCKVGKQYISLNWIEHNKQATNKGTNTLTGH